MFRKWCIRLLLVFLGIWLLWDLASHLGAEIFWFREVGYLQVFWLKLVTQGVLWVIVVGVTSVYLLGNLLVSQQLKHPQSLKIEASPTLNVQNFFSPGYRGNPVTPQLNSQNQQLKLRWLLPLVLVLSLLVGLMLVHYGTIAFSHGNYSVNKLNLAVSASFPPEIIWRLGKKIFADVWYSGLIIVIAIVLLIYPQFCLQAIAVIFSLGFGWILSQHWAKVLQFFHPTVFNSTEPLFGKDISFYIFSLPVWELLELWLMGLCLYGFVSVALTYLLSGDSLSRGFFPGFTQKQQRHLSGLGTCLLLVISFGYWLNRYELVYSSRGVSYGASYTDVTAQLPAYSLLCALGVAIAFYLLWRMMFLQGKSLRWVIYSLSAYVGLVVAVSVILPEIVQYVIVEPNELQREQPYIQRTITLTRQAFDLDAIDAKIFNPQGTLTEADIKANDLTIRNIRLWDQQPLLATNRQLQQIRPYYKFANADIDRYHLESNGVTEKRQVLIAARELDYDAVPPKAQTWVNRNLVYTHGYGFTMSPVNTVAPGGLPEYFVKDIVDSNNQALTTSTPAIRNTVPIGQPRIYYGEITNNYVMTSTSIGELDYPSGSDNVYNTYDGLGGINIGSLWRKWLFAMYLKDWQILLSRDLLPDTKVLFRRNINQRIQAIAPFLQFDHDPYIVAADISSDQNQQFPGRKNYLYWLVDAYTTSDRYPYSDGGKNGINYIRNSVKIVIDAYNGSVNFYIADSKDPIISTWKKIFPQMFKSFREMPVNLRKHIRYPVDFFQIQSERLMIYHMTDPQVFYNREDQWQIPNEIYGSKVRRVEPYYLITSLPNFPFEEFILLLPYTPKERTNLIAWLAARSDGENYGKLLLYNFPKERLVYGPEQIEARINQDPVISQQISLWNRQGSRAIQGNLLVIPIEQSLLYVEPIYLEATENSLPTLVRVVVAYENRIVMTQTLEQALQAIFQPEATAAPPIIRPLQENADR